MWQRSVLCVVCAASSLGLASQPHVLRLTRELVIGDEGRDQNPAALLTATYRLHIRSNGRVVVEQALDHVLREIDSNGRYLRTIGRRGSGPGETSMLQSSGLIGDTLWTLDGPSGRAALFDANGRVL
jgi:hypothetical protein